jgi:NAD(P)-dependent dehydrogenase (short-subunit alcohol dehydrogenase family)
LADKQKAAVVTGAAGGIGRAACERLAAGGWQVLAVDRDAEKLLWAKDVAAITTLSADVSSEADNRAIAAAAEERFGGLDAAVLNAGISGGGSIDALPFDAFRRVIEINLFGPVLGIKALLPLLRRRTPSAIVVTSSTMGVAADADNWAYGSSKHGVIGLVRSLAREIGWEGIRINALCPGPTQNTGMTAGITEIAPDRYELLRRNVPLQRWADADEMASVIEFLVSPASSYVNGMAMVADGGAMIGTGLLPPKASANDDVVAREL